MNYIDLVAIQFTSDDRFLLSLAVTETDRHHANYFDKEIFVVLLLFIFVLCGETFVTLYVVKLDVILSMV